MHNKNKSNTRPKEDFSEDWGETIKLLPNSLTKRYYCVFSLRIRLIFDKKTVAGIMMNTVAITAKIIVQLSPMNAPFF
jgi:hypothetical protein